MKHCQPQLARGSRPGPALFLALPLILCLAGCGSSRPPLQSWLREFEDTERDVEALPRSSPAAEMLRAGEEKRDQAKRLMEKGRRRKADEMLELALSDARTALAAASAAQASEQAGLCLLAVEKAQRRWEDALRLLIETEQIARKTVEGVPHDLPSPALVMPVFPPTTTTGSAPPREEAVLTKGQTAWTQAADSSRISIADLTSRLNAYSTSAQLYKNEERARLSYLAGRTLQQIEARVRTETSQDICGRAAQAAGNLADAADRARGGTLDLERSLRDDLRTALEKTRVEAESRQTQLYDALQQIQGKFARISRDARGTIVSLADILFDFDKDTLKRNVEFSLVRVATILNQFPEMKIAVEGHTDNVGLPEYNLDLSRRRAQAVHDFLITMDVSADRMTVEGYGAIRPVSDNETEEGRQKNRRVDLVIQDEPKSP